MGRLGKASGVEDLIAELMQGFWWMRVRHACLCSAGHTV